jgi:hypothetical protein
VRATLRVSGFWLHFREKAGSGTVLGVPAYSSLRVWRILPQEYGASIAHTNNLALNRKAHF